MPVLSRLYFSLILLILAPALIHAATLENPGNGSFYSGIGVISGWKCEANGPLFIRFNRGVPIFLAYGNERADVLDAGACPSAHVGFVSIINWANLGDGPHTAVVYDNGGEFARSTFEVATTGESFVRGAEGECRVEDFPALGESMQFAWNQSTQHLEMVNHRGGDDAPGVPRNVRVVETGEDFVAVEWDPPPGGGAVSYNVYYRSPNEPEGLLGNVSTTGTRVSGTVIPGECYRVTSVNATGVEGEKSPQACVQTQQLPDGSGGNGGPATLENPGNGSFYSGIGVVSGWKCTANGPLTVRFNGGDPIALAYGNERTDVRDAGACPSAQVGFVSIMNWANLGGGTHTAVVYDNGREFARSTFEVATTGEAFVRGAEGECRVPDFPAPGETMPFVWNEATQHLELLGPRSLYDDPATNFAFATDGDRWFVDIPHDSEDIHWYKYNAHAPALVRISVHGANVDISGVYVSELDGHEWTARTAENPTYLAAWEGTKRILIGVKRRGDPSSSTGTWYSVKSGEISSEHYIYNGMRFSEGDPTCPIFKGWVWPPRSYAEVGKGFNHGGQCYKGRDECKADCDYGERRKYYCVSKADEAEIDALGPGALHAAIEDQDLYQCGPDGPGPGAIDCNNAWTGSQGDIQVTSHCLAACAAAQAGDIQGRDANCSILRTYERHFPGTVLRYCPVCNN